MRGEYDAHAGLRESAKHKRKPYRPERRSLPVLTVAKWVGIMIAVIVLLDLVV